jgi:hypothetical protein
MGVAIMKKKILISSIIMIIIAGIALPITLSTIHQKPELVIKTESKRAPQDYDTVMQKSALIIIGEALDNVTEENTSIDYIDVYDQQGLQLFRHFYSTQKVRIQKVIKGEYSSDIIQIREPFTGIIYGQLSTIAQAFIPLKQGKQYILFLIFEEGIYYLNHEYFKFNVDNKDIEENSKLGKYGLELKNIFLDKYKQEIKEVLE